MNEEYAGCGTHKMRLKINIYKEDLEEFLKSLKK